MFSIKNNQGLYSELLLLLDYIEDYEDLEWLGYYKNLWEARSINQEELKDIVGLIEDYLPPEIECDCNGCYLVNDTITAYTPIEGFKEDYIDTEYKEIVL